MVKIDTFFVHICKCQNLTWPNTIIELFWPGLRCKLLKIASIDETNITIEFYGKNNSWNMYHMTRMWHLNIVTFDEWPFVTFRDLSWLAVLGGVDSGLWYGLRTGRRREYKRHHFPLRQPYRCTNIERPICSHLTAEVPILHWIVSSL